MANIPIGTRGEQKLLVTNENAIRFLGMEGARVLSTPHMIGNMEYTCRNAVLPLLDEGYDTVGTHVNVAKFATRLAAKNAKQRTTACSGARLPCPLTDDRPEQRRRFLGTLHVLWPCCLDNGNGCHSGLSTSTEYSEAK